MKNRRSDVISDAFFSLARIATIVLCPLFPVVFTNAQEVFTVDTLKKLSIEDLLQMEVTSVSRRAEPLSSAPAAIQVITHEDIRRSGATSIPEALRLAGNIQIAQKSAHSWAISTRGFNTDLANKLLVLIDGRTVYTPLFSGVQWDRQDYLLEDIERIEVISGPGGTLWGANAVNGVINIITRGASQTQGLYAEAGGGTELRSFVGARYGGMAGDNVAYRVYGKFFDRDDAMLPEGGGASDSWNFGQAGFKIEVGPSSNLFTFQGDYYQGDLGLTTGDDLKASGGNFLALWNKRISDRSAIRLRVYFDHTWLDQAVPPTVGEGDIQVAPGGTLKDNLNTYDIDFHHTLDAGERHQVVWGFGLRHTHNDITNSPALAFVPEELDRDLYSAFFQDKISLTDAASFTIGTKVEHNDYTGFEFEPSARFQYNLKHSQMLWAAVSRAVRMPSRVDRHIRLPTPNLAPFVENLLIGGEDFRSEVVIAYEAGYRAQIASTLFGSFSLFYNDHDHLRSTSLSPPDPIFQLPFPFYYDNNLEGASYGIELTLTWQALDWWKLQTSYNYFESDIRVKSGKEDFNNALNETADPKHRFSVRSSMELGQKVELDAGYRWIDEFTYNRSSVAETFPSYHELEVCLNWRLSPALRLSVAGQNLLHDEHEEYPISGSNRSINIQRNVYGKLAVRLP
jgi:iron complex outermembrane receptor protein